MIAIESPTRTHDAALSTFNHFLPKVRLSLESLVRHAESGSFDPDGNYWHGRDDFFCIGNWTSSFHTGMALLAWRHDGGQEFLDQVLRLAPLYQEKVGQRGDDTMHDLGFLYSLYSVALYQITGDPSHRETGIRAARLLAGRMMTEAGCIRAWGRMDRHDPNFEGLAIIDCMMNLPLLFWAARETGEASFAEIATIHAETTRRYFIRDDDSVSHAYRFDETTGEPLRQDNYCGHAPDSHWARGTAWAIYGFALAFKHTGNPTYLDAAHRLSLRFVSLLGDDMLPVWDFRLSPGIEPIPDTSAAAIAICGISEILNYLVGESTLRDAMDGMLARLCQPDCLDLDPSRPGILKMGQVSDSSLRAHHVYTSWGDYFLMEALSRKLGSKPGWW